MRVVARVTCSFWGDTEYHIRLFYNLPCHLACIRVVARVTSSFLGETIYPIRLF